MSGLIAWMGRLLLWPAVIFLRTKFCRRHLEIKFTVLTMSCLVLGFWYPVLCPLGGIVFILCLSISFLHHKIYQEQRAIIEGGQTEKEATWLVYDPLLQASFLFCIYPVLLISLIFLLRQATLWWGSKLFHPPVHSLGIWVVYAVDMIFKAALFDIPEIYHLDLVSIEHVGFWGATLVFLSRLVILVLIIGALLRWKEIYELVRDTVGILDKYPQLAETRLLSILRMFPAQLKRICRWSDRETWSPAIRSALLEVMGKTKIATVLPVLENAFSRGQTRQHQLAALRGMEFLGTGHPQFLEKSLESSLPQECEVRVQICATLAAWKTSASIQMLGQAAQLHADPATRMAAIRELAQTGQSQAVELLTQVMYDGHAGKEERFAAKDSIITIGRLPAQVRELLCDALHNSPHPDNRRFAAMVLGKIYEEGDVDMHLQCLAQEQDADARTYIVQALGNMSYRLSSTHTIPAALPVWAKAFESLNKIAQTQGPIFVRVAAIQALVDFSWLVANQVCSVDDFQRTLQPLAQGQDTQLADAANQALARLAQLFENLQFTQRRECITAVGVSDLGWRNQEISAPAELPPKTANATPQPPSPDGPPQPFLGSTTDIVADSSGRGPNDTSKIRHSTGEDIPHLIESNPFSGMATTPRSIRLDTKHSAATLVPPVATVADSYLAWPDQLKQRYQPLAQLSYGKVSLVYKVLDNQDQQEKVLKYLLRQEAWAKMLFLRELKILNECRHPGIISVLESSMPDIDAFTMPWIHAPTLFQASRQKKSQQTFWKLEEILAILGNLCETVAFLHQSGWGHGDLKPENILYTPGRLILLDFNSAYPLAPQATDQVCQTWMAGTPYYMAPEQLHQASCDERTDIYALGVIGYELLTGVLPMGISPLSVRVLRRDMPPQIQEILARATAFYMKDRFASVQEFWKALHNMAHDGAE